MSERILDQNGDVYMELLPPVPSRGDSEGWFVRHVSSGSHSTACGCSESVGTAALDRSDVRSFNGLLDDLSEFEGFYGYRPRSSKILDGTFRWTFERVTDGGHRVSDMLIASKIN